MLEFTHPQRQIIESALDHKLFVTGPAGTGKSTAARERVKTMLAKGVSGDTILILTPQRTIQEPFLEVLHSPERQAGGEVTSATVGGLARRMCDLFWPLAVDKAGFTHPDRPPVFLTLETAQYYMAHLVRPQLDQGAFESVTIDRNRLYSQILDNLNKSASVGFPHTEIGARLDSAWLGDPGQRRIYTDAQACATLFRDFCLRHNLLDFSLQLEVFWNHLWPEPLVRDFLIQTYRHLIYDNIEEDVPRAHDLMRLWLPQFDSALLILDEGGGYRGFLGADPDTALALRELCDSEIHLDESLVMSPEIEGLSTMLEEAILPAEGSLRPSAPDELPMAILQRSDTDKETPRYYPELLEAVTDECGKLIEGGLSPSEIVILAPFVSDALRFAVTSRLEVRDIPWRTHRPSRSLHDEPAALALLTLAALAHPHWNLRPSKFDAAYAFMLALDMDLVRAQLLAEIVYRIKDFTLTTFEQIQADKQERITFVFGNRYTELREWLMAYRADLPLPLDHFLRRLFSELLSQPGYGFHRNLDAARVAASLIESIRKFRLAMEPSLVDRDHPDFDLGKEYVAMLQEGVIAAQYLESWQIQDTDAVLVAPAYTFLLMNRPAEVQIWLDPGSSGWFERLDQPLTHMEVLSREWPAGRLWTSADEEQANRKAMRRLVAGLLHRCRRKIYLGLSSLSESGFEQRGELLKAFQRVLASQNQH